MINRKVLISIVSGVLILLIAVLAIIILSKKKSGQFETKKEPSATEEISSTEANAKTEKPVDDKVNGSSFSENTSVSDPEEDASADIVEDSYLDIDPSDCENKCRNFSVSEELRYCSEYCGIGNIKLVTENCNKLEDLEQDYCYKHQAKVKKDNSLCQNIEDENIKQACNKQKI